MSRDGYLPDDVSEARFDAAFPPDCPDECASMREVHSECGSMGECRCYDGAGLNFWTLLRAWWRGPCGLDGPAECDCPSLAEIKAERAERRAEAREDR